MVSFETAIRLGQILSLVRDLHLYPETSPSGFRYCIYLLSLLRDGEKSIHFWYFLPLTTNIMAVAAAFPLVFSTFQFVH